MMSHDQFLRIAEIAYGTRLQQLDSASWTKENVRNCATAALKAAIEFERVTAAELSIRVATAVNDKSPVPNDPLKGFDRYEAALISKIPDYQKKALVVLVSGERESKINTDFLFHEIGNLFAQHGLVWKLRNRGDEDEYLSLCGMNGRRLTLQERRKLALEYLDHIGFPKEPEGKVWCK